MFHNQRLFVAPGAQELSHCCSRWHSSGSHPTSRLASGLTCAKVGRGLFLGDPKSKNGYMVYSLFSIQYVVIVHTIYTFLHNIYIYIDRYAYSIYQFIVFDL